MNPSFVHLHVHSEFSLIDGMVRIKSLVAHAKATKMPAVAITDLNNLFAVVRFYKEALRVGIKPIIGSEIFLANPKDPKKCFRLVLLCQTQKGYANLTQLLTRAYLEGQATGVPVIEMSWLEQCNEGLIALSGGLAGDVGQAIQSGNAETILSRLHAWQKLFPARFYLELQRTGKVGEEEYLQQALYYARELSIPVVATNNVRFIDASDFEAHEARYCICQGYLVDAPNRPREYTDQQYLKSPLEMQALFTDIPEAVANSVAIAKRCNASLDLGNVSLPDFPTPNQMSVENYLIQRSTVGLTERLQFLFAHDPQKLAENTAKYQERLNVELPVINKMGYAGYFLIVADFISWAKANGVPVGPGRGSGPGSLVAYALGITDIDPLQYDLLFERFLNPERVSMPDFDVDFCMDGRDRVIEYVAKRYGKEKVSQIITFGTMAAKAVVRDVGRVLGYPYGFVDKIAKLIPFELGITLEKALEQEATLADRYKNEEDVKNLIDLAKKLEGLARNAGKHAGGVVIAPSQLTAFAPLYCEPGGESNPVTQFDKDDVEAVGLVKFDFLGLRTLTIIDWTLAIINAKNRRENLPEIDITKIDLHDAKTFLLLKAYETTGVFQLESRGMKDLIKRLQPDCFEDIIALVALFRPGPLQSGMVDDFIGRKQGRLAIEYPHPMLSTILKPTYGVILYQEQVMQIAQVLAGYTLGGADMLRRAMGKKKPEEMAKQRNSFLVGAEKNGIQSTLANQIFDLMEKFAGYGFNKSHSAAYAMVSYQTAWLKAHYPAAFMAAVLSSDMDHTDKVVTLIDECRNMRLNILSPNINQSHYAFTVKDDATIYYGLGAIKGVGQAAIELIIKARAEKPFTGLFDLCQRVETNKVNRRVLEALIRAGSMDEFGVNRASLIASVDMALLSAEQIAKRAAVGQMDLFAVAGQEVAVEENYTLLNDWTKELRLQGEKETLGIYFSGHPIEAYLGELKQFVTGRIATLNFTKSQTLIIAGYITAIRVMMTRRGDRMAFITLDDQSGRVEMAAFSDCFYAYRDILHKDQLIITEAESSFDEYSGKFKLNAKRVFTMETAREYFAELLLIKVDESKVQTNFIDTLKNCLTPFSQGPCPVGIEYHNAQGKSMLQLPQKWSVYPSNELLVRLVQLIGDDCYQFCYRR